MGRALSFDAVVKRRVVRVRNLDSDTLGLDPEDLGDDLLLHHVHAGSLVDNPDHQSHVAVCAEQDLGFRLPLPDMPARKRDASAHGITWLERRNFRLGPGGAGALQHLAAFYIAILKAGVIGVAFRRGVEKSKLPWVDAELSRDNIPVGFRSENRLQLAGGAYVTAGHLIGVNAQALEARMRHLIGAALGERAAHMRRRTGLERAVGAAVINHPRIARPQTAVALDAAAQKNHRGMPR